MQVYSGEGKKAFTPAIVEITFETELELLQFMTIFGSSNDDLNHLIGQNSSNKLGDFVKELNNDNSEWVDILSEAINDIVDTRNIKY